MTAAYAAAPERKINLVQGEYVVSADPGAVLTTILGSCVAACLRDPTAGVGGMNHFLLPGEEGSEGLRYGVQAMELLVNDLLRRGARRDRLEGKLFGGARLLQGLTDIGRLNAEFARRFLDDEGIAFAGGSLGGEQARRIQFWAVSGRARQHLLQSQAQVFTAERTRSRMVEEPAGDDLELF